MSGLWGAFEKSVFGRESIPSEGVPVTPPGTPPPPIPQQQVQQPKWNTRLRRFLRLTTNVGAQAYGSEPFPAIVLNRFTDEDYFPDEPLTATSLTIAKSGGATRTIIQVGLGAQINTVSIFDVYVQRLDTAGEVDIFWSTLLGGVKTLSTPIVRDQRLFPTMAGVGAATFSGGGVQLQGNNTQAAFAPAAFVSLFTGAAVNPAILPSVVTPTPIGLNVTEFLTIQPSIDNEGLTVTVITRTFQTPSA